MWKYLESLRYRPYLQSAVSSVMLIYHQALQNRRCHQAEQYRTIWYFKISILRYPFLLEPRRKWQWRVRIIWQILFSESNGNNRKGQHSLVTHILICTLSVTKSLSDSWLIRPDPVSVFSTCVSPCSHQSQSCFHGSNMNKQIKVHHKVQYCCSGLCPLPHAWSHQQMPKSVRLPLRVSIKREGYWTTLALASSQNTVDHEPRAGREHERCE